MGSTRAASPPGIQHATIETSARSRATPRNVAGSVALTPKSRDRNQRVSASADYPKAHANPDRNRPLPEHHAKNFTLGRSERRAADSATPRSPPKNRPALAPIPSASVTTALNPGFFASMRHP